MKKSIFSLIVLIAFILSGCGGGGGSSDTQTSSIELLSPREMNVAYSYITLEVGGNISDVKAVINGIEYVGVKNGKSFYIYNIALNEGNNRIELIADSGSKQKIVEISSEYKGIPPIELDTGKREGFESLDTTIEVKTALNVTECLIDKDSDGVIDDKKTQRSFAIKYTKEGRYFPIVTVKTANGTLYSTQKNISLDVKSKPTETVIGTVMEQVNDLERFGGYIWALSDTRIYKINENNESDIVTINLPGVSNPKGFTIDNNGDIIIADTGNNKVIKLSKSSNYSTKILEFGVSGNANGQLQDPVDVTVSGIDKKQEIYVLDSGNHRIQIFNSSGAYINKIDNENSGLSFDNAQNIIGSSAITLVDDAKILEIGLTLSDTVSKFTISDKYLNISEIGESTNGIVFLDKSKNQIVFLYPNGQAAKVLSTTDAFNVLIAFNNNSTIFGALESGGIKKIDIPHDPNGSKPIDIVKIFVDCFLNDDNSTMLSLMHGSDKYKKLYKKESIAKAVFNAIKSYSEKINNDFATVTAFYKTEDEEGEVKFNLVRSAGQMKSSNDWFVIDIY